MTDYDVSSELAILADLIYGGPKPPTSVVTKILKAYGLTLPMQIICVHTTQDGVPALPSSVRNQVRRLSLHNGLEYWCCLGDPTSVFTFLRTHRLVHGAALTCDHSDGILHAIRESIVSARRLEQRHLIEQPPDLASEPRLRTTLLARISARDPGYVADLDVWMSMVMVRHMRSLNSLRRKMLELLTAITRANDEKDLAYPFYHVVTKLFNCHTYSGLRTLMPELVAILLERLNKVRSGAGDLGRAQSPTVKAAVQFVRESFREPISLEAVAVRVGVSAPHLARSWRHEIGNSIGAALKELRLHEARRLLSEGNRTVLDVALRSGFGSVEHFHRTFRAVYKCSPDVWRKSVVDSGSA